jgi:hypothetical protein
MLSENGVGSSKRLVGSIAMLIALGCIVYLTITEGCTNCVEGLLQVLIITSCSLLGLSSITSIWKTGGIPILPKHKQQK